MRWEEALKIKQKWTPEQARNDLERLIITGERPADKVVGLACQALDKQIPRKPYSKEKYNSGYAMYCPKCNNYICLEPHKRDILPANKDNVYCRRCGQLLDWRDTE